jgi:hypothetical protein
MDLSGGESDAAFLTAAFDDQTSGVSSHAGKETEPTFAAPIGGLKSSFHLRFSLFFSDYMVYRIDGNNAESVVFTDYNFII